MRERGFSPAIENMSDSEHLQPLSEGAVETVQFEQPADSSILATYSLPNGTHMGHYVIKKYIGGGGMGQVYRATDAALDRDVAIKILAQQRAKDQATVARFLNEARSAARLNHEHIAQVYYAGEESDTPFIAFEFVEGTNVRTMVEEHDVFPLPQALNYLLQIAHALAHAASHGVIHRDVKPSNILITREGRAKLIDMGLARLSDTSAVRDDLTASGVTLGTFDYISPEQARDPRSADIRSDIYSLGCTFFFMLAGRPPFPEGTVLQKLLQHQGDAPPDIRSFQPTIPAEVAFLIQKMMAKDPKQRFQTPTVLIDALTTVARRLGLRPAGQGSLVWTHARPPRTSLMLWHLPWVTAVSLLFVGALLANLFFGKSKPSILPPQPAFVSPIATQGVDVVTPPVEPPVPDRSFDVAFVSHSVTPPVQYLTAPLPGGGLQSVRSGASTPVAPVSSTLSVADFIPASRRTTAGQASSVADVRCVDPTGRTMGSYLSIASALSDVSDGTIIELKWDGVHRITEPIRFAYRNLQFRAAAEHSPVLLFEPTDLQRSLFTVYASSLEFKQVGIDIRLDSNMRLTLWSLFELEGNVTLTFDQCALTIQNRKVFDTAPYHRDVVFFRNSTPSFLEGASTTEESAFEPLTIEVTNSLLRGEAVGIRSNVPQDLGIRFTNSLIALAKPFIHAEVSRRAMRPTTIQISWDKVAFFGRQGVAELQKETTAYPLVLGFGAQQSLFVLNRSHFAVFHGQQSRQRILDEFRWSGEKNYFQEVLGLQFSTPFSLVDSGMPEMPLEEWRARWTDETKEQTKIDSLILNEIIKPMSRYSPQDIQSPSGSLEAILPDLSSLPLPWYSL